MIVPLAIIEYSDVVRTRWALYLLYRFLIQHDILEKLSILRGTLTRALLALFQIPIKVLFCTVQLCIGFRTVLSMSINRIERTEH